MIFSMFFHSTKNEYFPSDGSETRRGPYRGADYRGIIFLFLFKKQYSSRSKSNDVITYYYS